MNGDGAWSRTGRRLRRVPLVALHVLAPTALWGLASLPLSLVAVALLWRHHAQPQRLRLALVLGIAAASVHGLVLAAGLCATQ